MKLSHELAKVFEEEIEKVIVRENKEPDYLNQKDFSCCRDRAMAGILDAVEVVADNLGLAIAVHEENEHGINTTEEQAQLLSKDSTDPDFSTMGFWSE